MLSFVRRFKALFASPRGRLISLLFFANKFDNYPYLIQIINEK